MVLKSYAKINLFLLVNGLRKDAFHDITTLFERISLYDTISIKLRRDKKINIISASKDIPLDSSNLALRSAKLLQDKFQVNRGADIEIIKRIPVGAGLGGGSSNAAYVLLGLNRLWKLRLSRDRLAELAAEIGSDAAFFIYGCRFALGRGRGENIEPLGTLRDLRLWHILVVPKIHVSTPLIYKGWDRLKAKKVGLTKPKYNVKILTLALINNDPVGITKALFNSLEPVTFGLYPEVKQVKERLLQLGVNSALMSGSGPAVVGITSSRKEALLLSKQLQQENSSWRVFPVKAM